MGDLSKSMFSETLWQHFLSPRNVGEIEDPDLTGVAGSPRAGPFFVFTFKIEDARVKQCKFRTYGCAPAIAAGSVLTQGMIGQRIEEHRAWNVERLVKTLGEIPEEKAHCYLLAIGALHNAFAKMT